MQPHMVPAASSGWRVDGAGRGAPPADTLRPAIIGCSPACSSTLRAASARLPQPSASAGPVGRGTVLCGVACALAASFPRWRRQPGSERGCRSARRATERLINGPTTLDKELFRLEAVHRRDHKRLVDYGLVRINGEKVKDPKAAVEVDDMIAIGDLELERQLPAVLKYHKPEGLVIPALVFPKKVVETVPGLIPPWVLGGKFSWMKGKEADQKMYVDYDFDKPNLESPLQPWISLTNYIVTTDVPKETSGLLVFGWSAGKLAQQFGHPLSYGRRREFNMLIKLDKKTAVEEGLAAKLVKVGGADNGKPRVEVLGDFLGLGSMTMVKLAVYEGQQVKARTLFNEMGFEIAEMHQTSLGRIKLGDLDQGCVDRVSYEEEAWAAKEMKRIVERGDSVDISHRRENGVMAALARRGVN